MTFDHDSRGRPHQERVSVDALIAAAAVEPLTAEDDPTARLLGLVPDFSVTLDKGAVKRARIHAGLKASDIARQMSDRGWETQTSEVAQWEMRSGSVLVAARLAVLADILGRPVDAVTTRSNHDSSAEAVRSLPQFAALTRRWAELFRTSTGVAELALMSRMATAVHRGDAPDPESTLRTLELLVEKLEAGQ